MAGKTRHFLDRDGRYFARIVIPKKLRPFLENKSELREALGSDRRIALKKLSKAVAGFQAQITSAEIEARRAPLLTPAKPTMQPVPEAQLALRHYKRRIAQDEAGRKNDPIWANIGINDLYVTELRHGFSGRLTDDRLERLVGEMIDEFRDAGLTDCVRGQPEWRSLAMTLCVAEYEALERVYERDEGNFTGQPAHPVIATALHAEAANASITPQDEAPSIAGPVSLMWLFGSYFEAQKRIGVGSEAQRRWVSSFKHLIKFLGHDDALRLSKSDVVKWRDKRLTEVSAKTVADVDLAGLRAVLKWARDEDHIPANPVDGVKQRVKKAQLTRERGYTQSEAVAVLRLAKNYRAKETGNERTTEAVKMTSAKQWIPFICALTGARVTEVSQLRTQDFRQDDGVHVLRITPDAGSVKDGQYRDVPIHSQLIEMGLWEYAMQVNGPLFYTDTPGRDKVKAARMVSGRISTWLRKAKVVPPGVQPSHGWRHRFTTVAREAAIADRVINAIVGHAGRTAGERYGDVTIKTRKLAIDALPAYDLDH